ncbi:MAG TPA: hypothetical protein VFI12_06290 [Thermomicrobiales bacterium]|nr:hypothetical protein [Thermomicrobiales bacterium]
MDRSAAGIPDDPICAGCGVALNEPFGWCSNCSAAFCDACAATHFCLPTCQAAGCIAGLCVRRVSDGHLSLEWRKPGTVASEQ